MMVLLRPGDTKRTEVFVVDHSCLQFVLVRPSSPHTGSTRR